MTASLNFTTTLLILTVVLVLLPDTVHAFGAGDIPDFAFLNDKAFRHGDIENILSTLAKTAGLAAASHSAGGDLFGFAKAIIKTATSGPGGPKFSSSDIKKVYFGNWLRDYSQAMDIGGLSKLTAESLILVVSVLGFMTFGFATEEFQVTPERLGVYLPVEHIDNPKQVPTQGYAEKEGDARKFHPKLRPPVNPRELEIDTRTGMKVHTLIPSSTLPRSFHASQKYMASENEGWDTSTAHIRRVLVACIEMGRRAQGRNGPELYEAYRLLGTGLHTLEDLLAHSNWVEIALRKMGHSNVFCHVGDATDIETPHGRAPPLVTGTFGGADFLHSLMGEATDKLSQASVTDLASKMNQAQQGDNSNVSALKAILSKLPIGGGASKMNEGEQLHEEAKAYNFDPDNIAPPDVQQKLLQLLKWRDGLMRSILEKMEMIPGLDKLMDQLSNALNAYVYTVIAPWITPILQQATSVLGEGSKAVINSEDQYEVFDNPRASDPSHSLLSKDHFGLILNEPAGKIAILVVEHSVKIIVQAWSDNSNPSQAVDAILEAFHHPYYASGRSNIQNAMFQEMENWLGGLGQDEARETLDALTKESVRNGKNKRLGSENENLDEPGYGGCGHGAQPQRKPQGQSQSYGSGGQQQQQQYGESQSSYSSGNTRQDEEYNTSSNEYGSGEQERQQQYGESYSSGNTRQDEEYNTSSNEYGSGGQQYGESYSSGNTRQDEEYNTSSNEYGSGGQQYGESQSSYSGGITRQSEGYGKSSNDYSSNSERTESYGRSGQSDEYSSSRRNEETDAYGSGRGETHHREGHHGHGARRHDKEDEDSYGGGRSERNESSGYTPSYAQPEERSSGRGSSGYGRTEEQPSYGGGNEYGSRNESVAGRGEYGYVRSEEQQTYGGGGGEGRTHHGSSGYDRAEEQQQQVYGGGNEYGSSGRGNAVYGRSEEQGYDSSQGAYGSGRGEERGAGGYERQEESQYGREEPGRGADGYGRTEESQYGLGESERGGGYGQESSGGYDAEPESGWRGNDEDRDETFGAERLNINEGYGGNRGYGRNEDESNY
ncbi:heterokaryon incompatibility protein Het-C-domain-containing protein [Mycena epipterygia]|nr:heterokaryon incompatibility protein Het-C-domain-containing protein [Mycena epipterygia]